MDLYCGMDVSNKSTSLCVMNEKGGVVFETEVGTNESEIHQALSKYGKLKCVVEASPLAEAICQMIERGGHEIDILDPRQAKGAMPKKKKTDKLDACNLAQLCRTGWYTRVHRKSGRARELRTYLCARKQIVKTMTATGSAIRGLFRAHGIILPAGNGEDFEEIVRGAMRICSPLVRQSVTPLLAIWKQAHRHESAMYKALGKKVLAKHDESQLLQTVPGVGPATAAAFIGTIDDPTRFSSAEQVGDYLGLVPSVYDSGETTIYGRITKEGDALLRWLLVESATILLTRSKKDCPLREWGQQLQAAKGLGKARVAVARKLAGLLWAIWRNRTPYDPKYGQSAAATSGRVFHSESAGGILNIPRVEFAMENSTL